MKRALIAPLVRAAYTIYSTPSEVSTINKAAKFAGVVAHYAVASNLPPDHADTCSRLAAEGMLALIQNNYYYSTRCAQKKTEMLQAEKALQQSRAPWSFKPPPQQTSTALIPYSNHPVFSQPTETPFKSETFKQNKISLEQAESIYPRAFCVAFLAFERAAKTTSQKQFENTLSKALMQELAEPFSYSAFLLQVLKSKEMSAIMGVILFLGLILLALPSFELSALSASATYAIGGTLSLAGSAFHLWRACSVKPTPETENMTDLPQPATI